MKKVIVDMDGVMADVYHQLVQFEKRDTGRDNDEISHSYKKDKNAG